VSNRLAIAAVTLTLRNLIEREIQQILGGARVTTVPPDRARDANNDVDQVNLFLYQTTPNPALRNSGAPGQAGTGGEQTWLSPLALNLHYLVTAYGADGNSANDHRLLGGAMKALHDHPLLDVDDIEAALPESELHRQIERIRITLESPSTEEMSKLWSTFQSQYRVSASYQAAVVLIDSSRPPKPGLPVLKRGREDEGVTALASPFQSIVDVRAPVPFPSARLGDEVTIRGTQLDSGDLAVRFSNRRLAAPIELAPLPGRSESRLTVRIGEGPSDAAAIAAWVPGIYTVSLVVTRPNLPRWTTNEAPVALAPIITVRPTTAAPGDVLTVTPAPHLAEAQRDGALLLLGDHQVAVRRPDGGAPDLQFVVPRLQPGSYVIRLRVDGVDSHPIVRTGPRAPLEFDPAQMVTVS
jgi:Pvc16 N-terminal domain